MALSRKAKEWALRLADSSDLLAVAKEFFVEIGDISKARGGSLNAITGAVAEQRTKWAAVCRLCPKLAPSMFDSFLREFLPETAKTMEKIAENRKARQAKMAAQGAAA